MPDFGEAPGPFPDAHYVLGLTEELRARWAGRNGEYLKARLAYAGDHWEGQGLERPHDTRYSLTANYYRPFVDKSVQMLVGQLPSIMVEPPSADQAGRALGERIEGVLYGNWELNKAHRQLLNCAFHTYDLGRGILYYWWDPTDKHVKWKSVIPENFYPLYDGDELYEAVNLTRRLTRSLQRQYPQLAERIGSDSDTLETAYTETSEISSGITDALSLDRDFQYLDTRPETLTGYTTVVDWYDREGNWVRVMGDAIHTQKLGYPTREVPFIEFAFGANGDEREPAKSLASILELNQYYNQLLSQSADIIRKTADPPIIAENTGQDSAKIQAVVAAGDGSVLPVKAGGKLSMLTWEGSMPDIAGQMSEVRDVMFDLAGKPRSAFGQTITNQSGVVTNLALTPTLQSNELDRTVWDWGLERLNRRILELYEEFSKGEAVEFDTVRRVRRGAAEVATPMRVSMRGSEIGGWYRNTMKWPSAIRVDDPVYLDGVLKQLQSEPQALSLFDALELLGYQDVEARIDRIRAEREDPRIHPEVLEQTIASLNGLAGFGSGEFDGMAAEDGAPPDVMSEGEIGMQSGVSPVPVAA